MCFLCVNILGEKNNKQKRDRVSVGHDHSGIANMSRCGHKHSEMTLQMENIIRQEHQDHPAGGGKRMHPHRPINQNELNKPEEPTPGDCKTSPGNY